MQQKQNWKPLNTKGILRSVGQVLAKGNMQHLTKDAYHHITLHMGFIAHYDINGFRDVYRNVAEFARRLLTSEMSNDPGYNERGADHYMRDSFFDKSYGQPYCQSVTDCNVGIVRLAKAHLGRLTREADENQRQAEIAELNRLATRHGLTVTPAVKRKAG